MSKTNKKSGYHAMFSNNLIFANLITREIKLKNSLEIPRQIPILSLRNDENYSRMRKKKLMKNRKKYARRGQIRNLFRDFQGMYHPIFQIFNRSVLEI